MKNEHTRFILISWLLFLALILLVGIWGKYQIDNLQSQVRQIAFAKVAAQVIYKTNTVAQLKVVAGMKGAAGDSGTNGTGTAGAQGIAGTSFTWRGIFASGTNYAVNDIVGFNGSTYINILAYLSIDVTPDEDSQHWSLFTASGQPGDDGRNGRSVEFCTLSDGTQGEEFVGDSNCQPIPSNGN